MLAAALTGLLFYRTTERDEVGAYIEEVNETQAVFATRYGSVNQAFRQFDFGTTDPDRQLSRVRRAAQVLAQLRDDIEKIDEPDEARILHRRVVAFLRRQEAVAGELVEVMVYMPELNRTEAPLRQAQARLNAGLRNAESLSDQVRAVSAFGRVLGRVATQLEQVEPPPLLAPAHRGYARQLRGYATAARNLQRAVDANDTAAIEAAVGEMQEAAAAPPGSRLAQREAIKEYNRRVERIHELARAVEEERRRLEREL